MSDVIKHLDLSSADGAQLNMDALYQIMPSAFTEARDEKTGEVTRKVNFEVLRQLLGDNATDGDGEMYQFTWVAKMPLVPKRLHLPPRHSALWWRILWIGTIRKISISRATTSKCSNCYSVRIWVR